jgi:hypothetical protein
VGEVQNLLGPDETRRVYAAAERDGVQFKNPLLFRSATLRQAGWVEAIKRSSRVNGNVPKTIGSAKVEAMKVVEAKAITQS